MAMQVTLEQARKKLGMRGDRMSDKEVLDLLTTLRRVCDIAIDSAIEKNYRNNKQ